MNSPGGASIEETTTWRPSSLPCRKPATAPPYGEPAKRSCSTAPPVVELTIRWKGVPSVRRS